MNEREWIDRGKREMTELLDREHAVVWPEVEARLAEAERSTQPHLLTKARQELVEEGTIESSTDTTRGGRSVTVWHPADLAGRARAVEDAAGRKRLLYARHQSWSSARRGIRAASSDRRPKTLFTRHWSPPRPTGIGSRTPMVDRYITC